MSERTMREFDVLCLESARSRETDTKGTAENIFSQLEFESEEVVDLRLRADLMILLQEHIRREGFTLSQAAKRLNVSQSEVERLLNSDISAFSIDKLAELLAERER